MTARVSGVIEWVEGSEAWLRRSTLQALRPSVSPSGALLATLPARRADVSLDERECGLVGDSASNELRATLEGSQVLRTVAFLDEHTVLTARDGPGGTALATIDVSTGDTRSEGWLDGVLGCAFELSRSGDGSTLMLTAREPKVERAVFFVRPSSLEVTARTTATALRWRLHPDGAFFAAAAPRGPVTPRPRALFFVRSARLEEPARVFTGQGGEHLLDWVFSGADEARLLLCTSFAPDARPLLRAVTVSLSTGEVRSSPVEQPRDDGYFMGAGLAPDGRRAAFAFVTRAPHDGPGRVLVHLRDVVRATSVAKFSRALRVNLGVRYGAVDCKVAWRRDGQAFTVLATSHDDSALLYCDVRARHAWGVDVADRSGYYEHVSLRGSRLFARTSEPFLSVFDLSVAREQAVAASGSTL